jgi:hypothetical protein
MIGFAFAAALMLAASSAAANEPAPTPDEGTKAPSTVLPPPPEGGSAAAPSGETPGASPTSAPAAPPVPTPAPAPAPAPAPQPQPAAPPPQAQPQPAGPAAAAADELPNAGYVPGYRTYKGLSLSPYTPRVGALPGGVTPAYGAPMPFGQWTFRYSGFMSASFQSSVTRRVVTAPGQNGLVFHIPAQTVDEYASFVGTSTMPGQWVAMNFGYGNRVVNANISLNTWNPSDPTTYYQIGSQYFINNAYIEYNLPDFGKLHLRTQVGYFYNYYGNLGQYTPGMYTNSVIGYTRGVGETTVAEYRLSPSLTVVLEDGFLGNRNGQVPPGVNPTPGNTQINPIFAASWVHHAHLSIMAPGEPSWRAGLHYMTNWAQDDRIQMALDNPATRDVNEAYIPDGKVTIYGIDAGINHGTWGYLAGAASYTKAENAFSVKGLWSYGGDGQLLADRWFGSATTGTGQLYAAGLNYTADIGKILSAPVPFGSNRPDLLLQAGFIIAYATTNPVALSGTTDAQTVADYDTFNKRLRYKFGLDLLYNMLPWFGAGIRGDRVAPTSKDSEETFYVLSPRLVFKTNWVTHEEIRLIYGKWFYGPHTHPEASGLIPADQTRLDDQLIALNINMWW